MTKLGNIDSKVSRSPNWLAMPIEGLATTLTEMVIAIRIAAAIILADGVNGNGIKSRRLVILKMGSLAINGESLLITGHGQISGC